MVPVVTVTVCLFKAAALTQTRRQTTEIIRSDSSFLAMLGVQSARRLHSEPIVASWFHPSQSLPGPTLPPPHTHTHSHTYTHFQLEEVTLLLPVMVMGRVDSASAERSRRTKESAGTAEGARARRGEAQRDQEA